MALFYVEFGGPAVEAPPPLAFNGAWRTDPVTATPAARTCQLEWRYQMIAALSPRPPRRKPFRPLLGILGRLRVRQRAIDSTFV